MKLLLHIGTTKTGTSAIQSFLWRWRDILFKKYKILYPTTGIFFGAGPAHYKFTWFYFKDIKNRIRNSQILHEFQSKYKSPQQLIEELVNEIINKAYFPDIVILSSENYSDINPYFLVSDYSILKKRLQLSKIVIVIYLRRQDKWLEAAYSQHVKGGNYKNFKHLKNNYLKKKDLFYYELISHWQQAILDVNIIPRIYERQLFPEGNVILDFISILGIDMPEAKEHKIEANPSLSVLSSLTLRKINEKFKLTAEDHKKIVKYLIKLDQEGSPVKTFFTLPERIAFLEHYRESNERLFREWFGTENQFVLSEEEIEFYEEQDKIPREEIEKMVEDRYRKVVAYMMEEGLRPKSNFIQYSKPNIRYYPCEEVEFMNVDVLQLDLLKDKLTIGGLVLLKREVEGEYKLIAKADEKEIEVKWSLPSPGLASKYPDNPKGKEARFQIQNLISKVQKIEIMLDSRKIMEIELP